ncbi:DUF4402 domain-containing protein [Sessilibacter sp. MAH4]
MKSTLSKLAAGLLMASTVVAVNAQQATNLGDATAEIQFEDITLTQVTGIDFGVILPFGRTGSLSVAPNGTNTRSNILQTVAGTPAEWSVTGVPNAPFSITFPTSINISTADGENTMRVDNFNTNFRSGTVDQTALDGSGERTVLVGARLVVNANQPAGIYSGQYQMTVAYN